MQESVYIGLGTNLGDRERALLEAVAEIGKLAETKVTALSPFYETEPVGGVAQPNFYNAVLRISTALPPETLLEALKRIEQTHFHRVPTVHWGPRSMDLDILLYGDLVRSTSSLTIPHPRLHERRFVLAPLSDIAPELTHPRLGRSVAELFAALPPTEKVARL